MDSDIESEGKESANITVSTKGCICGNVVGENTSSRYLGLKDRLDMSIEGLIRISSRGERRRINIGWEDTLTGTKTRFHIWGA